MVAVDECHASCIAPIILLHSDWSQHNTTSSCSRGTESNQLERVPCNQNGGVTSGVGYV